ncbi:MAG: hypothetical protein UY54_C0010G0011 [Parcubacteria group bacterium GW2011_GWA2_50_10b]|nr:MAG: hypothetical protein UY54_C0010G0011 [Parcubacteria group bacterium GW2011_GWA2_50_10b]
MLFNLPRHEKVAVGHFAADIEALQFEKHLAVVDARVRMVVIRLEDRGHSIDESQRMHEVLELILLRDFALPARSLWRSGVVLELPAGQGFEPFRYFLLAQYFGCVHIQYYNEEKV